MELSWTERHRPRALSEVLGNAQAVADLRRWAQAWAVGKPQYRAALLAGPPGTGKTSAAHALAREFSWEVIELNASDARSAEAIRRVAGVGAVHQTFTNAGAFHSTREGGRKLIILDEADNLYERSGEAADADGTDYSDRGGKRAIADTVAETRQPIILIVNDAYALTRGSGERLAKASLRIAFRRSPAPTIRKRLREIAQAEGVEVAEPVLESIASRAQGDLRSAVNDLEAVSAGRSRVDTLPAELLGERNRVATAFDVVGVILKGQDLRRAVDAARDLDEPPDFLLAWLDENVPTEYRDPHDLARAYDRLSRADVFLGRTMRRQQFGLWGYATELLAGGVATAKTQKYGAPPQYRFPGWIRHMGATKGSRGVRERLGVKLGGHTHVGVDAFVRDILPDVRGMTVKDRELAEAVALRANLAEDEIRYLLGPDVPDSYAAEVAAHVEQARNAGHSAQVRFAPHATDSARKPSRSRGTSLGDF